MSLVKTPLEKAQGTRDAAARRLAGFKAERTALAARLGTEADFDANFALREDLDRLDRKIAAAEVALASTEEQLAVEQTKAANAEGDRRHAEAQAKLVPAHEKLIREIAADQAKLAAKLAQATELQGRINDANEARGHRPRIIDGELKLRGVPGRTEPAVFEDRDVWQDGAGNSPFQYRRNAAGEDVPIEQGYEKKRVRVRVRAEQVIPPTCPPRFADSIELAGLDGRRIWPR